MPRKKFLIALIGPVGSGKTYIAKILAKKLGAIHVRTDDIRVELRKRGKPYSAAPGISKRKTIEALKGGRSVVNDFDAVLTQRRYELKNLAKSFGAAAIFIQTKTPEKLIIERLRKKRYTKNELFRNAEEATRVYLIRRKLHQRPLRPKPDFVINNAQPLAAQINKIAKKLRAEFTKPNPPIDR